MKDVSLALLRRRMAKAHIDIYLVFLADDHNSEYVGEHFKETRFLTGFTGSNATLAITKDEAGIWTDGRYFVQAAKEIEGSGFTLFKMGEEGVPKLEEFVGSHLAKGMVLAYDGRQISASAHLKYKEMAEKVRAKVVLSQNLVDTIWKTRPAIAGEPLWILDGQYAGRSAKRKLLDVKSEMAKLGADSFLLTSLCDIAWLLNIRGNDIPHVPVVMSFLLFTPKDTIYYVQKKALSLSALRYLKGLGLVIRDYASIYADIKRIRKCRLLVDPKVVNAALYESLHKSVAPICADNPTTLLKCVKNSTEIANTRLAHIRDGVAVTKFIHFIKTHIGSDQISELSAASRLQEFRKEQPNYLEDSFATIAAYGPNAAMMHYTATKEQFSMLQNKGFFLVDSGGHYLEGTTDITRTIVLGEVTKEEKNAYTLVLRAALRLMAAHFPKGTYCQNLDILARGPLWDLGLDYRCGTGHGVGHILNVHEGPNGFRTKVTEDYPLCELKPGMITTDEPGLYTEDAFGIRIENELLCVADKKTGYGSFLQFDNLTMAPIDLDAVEPTLLTQYEKDTLNRYHKQVYNTLRPYLTDEEAAWLEHETRCI